ncbi:anti-sigma factor [Cohnella sp. REN36]|uniref:anti-sigma factor n=1 Tax=Cohnella sp. REN36 TaxID=2887347 RepID=UPI001D1494AF|nr:anti-sigma factor [Cohnella sp. REN36]MCC3373437.1 anti-sigma factor [Cohnella sp. REN36]
MAECERGVPEERWIDWHRGRLPEREAAAMARHRAECACCRERWVLWGRLLADAERAPEDRGLAPWRRWLLRTRLRLRRRGPREGKSRLLVAGGVGVAFAALAVLLVASLRGGETGQADPMKYAHAFAPQGIAVMARPDTIAYVLDDGGDPSAGFGAGIGPGHANGTAWVNGRTQEVFVLIRGLLPSRERDVQAWAEYAGKRENLGVLEFHERQAHLYARNRHPVPWESLALSIEPKGGSAQPTSPETVIATLRQNGR